MTSTGARDGVRVDDVPSTVPAFMTRESALAPSRDDDRSDDPREWRDDDDSLRNRHRCASIANAAFDALATRAMRARDAHRKFDVPDDALETLAWLYGAKHLRKALEVVQHGRVRRVVAERSGRAMYAVTGSGASGGRGGEGRDETPYLCFPAHFCSCRSFFWESVSRGEALACKHQLAAKLASVLGAHSTTTVDDVLLGNMMMRYFEGDG